MIDFSLDLWGIPVQTSTRVGVKDWYVTNGGRGLLLNTWTAWALAFEIQTGGYPLLSRYAPGMREAEMYARCKR